MVTRRSSTITSFVKLGASQQRMGQKAVNTQVGANSRLVLVAEPLVHILVHEGGLADAARRRWIRGPLRKKFTDPLSPRIIT
jgi:hypothetical protein